jgi:hypothetical protein
MTYEVGARSAADELAAVQAGFGPLYEEWAASLGTLSHAASQIEAVQDGLEKAHANEIVLRNVADLLPHATGRWYQNSVKGGHDMGRFELAGEDQQFKAKAVQANTVWLRQRPSDELDFLPVRNFLPCYIIGRRADPASEDSAELLLLPASGIVDGIPYGRDYIPPSVVTVRKDELAARDQYAFGLFDSELSDDDRQAMQHPANGRLVVASHSPGSIVLTGRGRGQASAERVRDKGLRYDSGKTKVLSHGIDDETLDGFEVDTTVAHLVIAFSVTDAYKVILENGRPQDTLQLTRELRLAAQNGELRAALRKMLVASGMFDERTAAKYLNETYPPI